MLYIMRHGRTDWNEQYRLQGGTDIPLNEEGRRMAREAAETYRDVEFDLCYVSPLQRARETAELFLKGREIPVIVDERLREMGFGEYEGWDHIYQKPEYPIYKLFKDPEHYVADRGAESFEELFERTGEFLEKIVQPQLEEGKNILIIGHGAMNSAIINRIRKLSLDKFWDAGCRNCELIRLI
ncbi:MAG: histidine phosphatase family protein [Lachnospiraceae bacterium]|nr:histidine phosphatase family protein [Lachnospiraceae bacterium]